MTTRLPFTAFIALTLVVLLSPARADSHDHGDHDGGSQGGSGNIIGSFYDSCNQHKASCVGAVLDGSKKPSECYKTKSCDYMVAITKESSKYKFQLFGKLDQSNSKGYVAVGISGDGVKMAKSSIVECSASRSSNADGKLTVSWSEAEGRPSKLGESDSEYINKIQEPHIFNDIIVCEFYRDAKSTVKGNDFDLDKEKYRILLAIGGFKIDGSSAYHNDNRVLSEFMQLKSDSPRNVVPSVVLVLLSVYVAWR